MNTGTARYVGITIGRLTVVGQLTHYPPHARLDIDAVVALLAVEAESVLLEYPDDVLEMNRRDGGHRGYLMLIVRRSIDTNSGARQPSPSGS